MDTSELRSVVFNLLKTNDVDGIRALTDPLVSGVNRTLNDMVKMITEMRHKVALDNEFLYLVHIQNVTVGIYDKDELAMMFGAALLRLSELEDKSNG